jgi:CheY-like chemotaxis protein
VLSSPTAQSFRNARVLVIDDDEIALQAICDVLEEAGFQVRSMVSPIGATQVIAADGIQAAVIDLNMPLMSGDRLVSLIRSWDRLRDLPVVLISGTSAKTLEEVALQLPDVPVVTKDSMRRVLVSVVSRALSARAEFGSTRDDPGSTTVRIRREEVTAGFLKGLPDHAQRIQRALSQLLSTPGTSPDVLLNALSTLRAQAQLAALEPIIKLAQTFSDAIGNSAGSYSLELQAASAATCAVLAGLAQEKGGPTLISIKVAPALARLERLAEKRG